MAGAAALPAASSADNSRTALQKTLLITRALDGTVPNGPSTNPVISNDRRYARAIAFESEASDLVNNDTNGVKDVFAVLRTGKIDNFGAKWEPGRTVLISRTATGEPANGPSFAPTIDGSFETKPRCVGFLSSASNIVGGDTNGVDDAFITPLTGGAARRISRPGGRQATAPTTAVAVSGNCKVAAFVTGGRLYVKRSGGKARRVKVAGPVGDPSYSTGRRSDLVFTGAKGVYLKKQGTRRARLVARGAQNPAYNDIKRHVVTFERRIGNRLQVLYKDLGKGEHIISSRKNHRGDGDSRDPVIGNSGYYITFESDAGNLGTNVTGQLYDVNGQPDVYLYSNVRDITLVQSVIEKAIPLEGGGQNPSMSFYANYIVFDATLSRADPAHLFGSLLIQSQAASASRQIYMRYLGPV
jgi:hypothetical protein